MSGLDGASPSDWAFFAFPSQGLIIKTIVFGAFKSLVNEGFPGVGPQVFLFSQFPGSIWVCR